MSLGHSFTPFPSASYVAQLYVSERRAPHEWVR
jgi:hypothetical protein